MLYVNKCELEVNGLSFTDFESFTDGAVTYHKPVNMMNKTGFAKMTPRHGFSAVVKVSVAKSVIDLDNVSGGTFTVEYEGGRRDTYGGVYTLDRSEGSINGETELTYTYNYGSETKVKE
jgi:hypothetical protein